MTCERCGSDGARRWSLVILVDYGWLQGSGREVATFELCQECGHLGDELEPIEDIYAFLNPEEKHDSAST